MAERYIIIGSGIAGMSAAEAIREKDKEKDIIIFTSEADLPYSRPMLTKTPLKNFDGKLWNIKSREWLEENNIELLCGGRITEISTADKKLSYESTEKDREGNPVEYGIMGYDKLIIASGAEPFVPPFKGAEGKTNLFTVRRAEDILKIKASVKTTSEAVVIGGGVIGIEMAVELMHYGVKVTIVEAAPYFMARQIDEEISNRIRAELLNNGMMSYVGAKIEELIADPENPEKISAVKLGDGTLIPCDFVVAATGVKANTSFIDEESGIKVNRAIDIDEYARTSAADVFACGDCAEYKGVNYALWSQGIAQGRAAGINAASESGCEEKIGEIDTSLVINSPEISIFALGDNGKNPEIDYEIQVSDNSDTSGKFFVNENNGKSFEKRYYADGKLVGAMIVGNLSNMTKLKDEMK